MQVIKKLPLILLCASCLNSPIAFAEAESKAAATPQSDAFHHGVAESYQAKKVAEHTYVIHGPLEVPNEKNAGFMNNPAFIVGEKAVAVIDPGSSVQIGRGVLMQIKKISDKPVTMVFNTHVHGDHWLGNHAFVEANPDVKIYAHPKMIAAAEAGEAEAWIKNLSKLTKGATDGTKASIATEALEDGQIVKLGKLSIKAHLGEHVHSKTDAMFEFVEDKVLFTGDNVTAKRIPRMDDGSFQGSITTIAKALELDVEKVVPGHGETGGKTVLSAYKTYLSTLYESVKTLSDEGLEDFEMKEKVAEKLQDYTDWAGFDKELGKHISLAILEAEQAAFE
jgi:glyoxylase-like metal-dependent hydrolase (beta-lactamase superfamily II)